MGDRPHLARRDMILCIRVITGEQRRNDLAEFSLFCCFPARCRYHDIISQSYCFCLFYFPVIYLCDDFKADGVLVRSVMDICCKLGNIFR